MKNIYLLTTRHQFDVINGISDLIAEGIKQNGHRVNSIDISTEEGKLKLLKLQNEKIDLILGMVPETFLITINGNLLHNLFKTKFAILFMDNPIYTRNIWSYLFDNGLPEDSLLLFVDAMQAKQMRNICDHKYNKNYITQFFPWASNVQEFSKFGEDKKIFDVCVFATLDQQLARNFMENDLYRGDFSNEICNKIGINHGSFDNNIKELIVKNFDQDIIDFSCIFLEKDYVDFGILEDEFAKEIDSYLKRYRRFFIVKKMIEFALAENLDVGIFGTGWENLNFDSSKIKYFGSMNYMEQFNIFRQSRAVLNIDPNWNSGVHDRVFNAFSAGCAVITNYNKFTDLNFIDNHNCNTFENLDVLNEKIFAAVSNNKNLALNAIQNLSINHTWHYRCNIIISYLDYVGS